MIQIYDIGNENYDRNGNAVLTPTAGRVNMQAGGACDISLTLPMDPDGKWRHVVPGAVVKAPVPREVIENSFSGYAADIYKTTGQADLREDKVAPTRINYPQWNAMDMTYTVGSRVSCYGWPHQNYECTYFDNSSPITQVPPYNSAWWKPIADYTPGAAVVVSLPAGSELYWIENAGTGWYKMSTYYGVTGYIQTSAVVFDRHVSETENQPRIITEQLFRLREPSINNETRTVTVTGQHVSYDLAGILCKNITITQASPAMAMGRVVENMMMDYRGTIATNLTSDENGTYTGKTNGKNGMFMLLDPDAGIVRAFNAKFTRDNWDVFVMKKTSALSGFRISYAKNMRGVTWKKSSAGLVTRVVPVAKNTDGEDLYLPEKWVDSAHIADYPVILMELLRISAQVGRDDGTGTDTIWTESALYDYMREKAGERFSVDHVDEVVDDLTVQFEQLGDTSEYEWVRPLESVLLYDNIVCQDLDIGLEKVLTVTELEWDPIRRKVTGIRLSNITGAAGRTVTGFNVQNNSITPAKLTEEVTQEIVGQVQALIPDYTDPQAGKYTLPPASSTDLGGIKIGFQASGKNYPVALDTNNKAYVYVPWDPGSYDLPLAQDGVRGGIQIGFQASGKNYPVALDGEKAYVYVPWEDHYDWGDITNKPATATRWPTWDEVTGKPTFPYLPLAGGNMTGGIQYPTTHSDNMSANWISVGGGYSTNTGKNGLKLLVCEQSDAHMGLGSDLSGDAYELSLVTTQNGNSGIIAFCTHQASNWKSYTRQGYINTSGNFVARGDVYAGNTISAATKLVRGDGTGASGTWGINVTGSAGSVPWGGVTDKPATATRWPTWAEVTGKPNRAGAGSDGGSATSAVKLDGFTAVSSQTWGNQTGTFVHGEDDSTSGSWAFRRDNPSSGQCSFILDGTVYIKEGNVNVGDAIKNITRSGTTFTATTLWGNTFTFTQQDNDHHAWNDITDKPATATRWPTWDEVTGKPNFPYLPLAGGTMTGRLIMESNPVWIQGGSSAGTDTNRLTTTAGMPSEMAYGSGKRGVMIYSNGIAMCDPYKGTAANDGAWIRHIEETANVGSLEIAIGDDASNENIYVRRYNTQNTVVSSLTLLDSSGNTSIPGILKMDGDGIQVPTTASNSQTTHWISAGGGYSANSGKSGLKILAVEQSDAEMGFGADLTGGPYELSIAATQADSYGMITFCTHTMANKKSYTRQGRIDTNGNYIARGNVYAGNSTAAANKLVRGDGTGASGTWEISITGNADTVDSYHAEDLLTEVDTFKRRLQVRTGTGTLANNTDTYIPFSSPFSTLCTAVVPVSTSGFNAPNALSIVSNNKNGVTLKQNNTLGVSMNVIVVAFGY